MSSTFDNLHMCGACLATDVKMFDMSKTFTLLRTRTVTSLSMAVSRMLGIAGTDLKNKLLCFECAAMMRKYDEFRYKYYKAYRAVKFHVYKVQNLQKDIDFKDDVTFMERRKLLASQLKVSLNIAVTSILPSDSEIFFSDNNVQTEFDENETDNEHNMNNDILLIDNNSVTEYFESDMKQEDDYQNTFESDTEKSVLHTHNETLDKDSAQKIQKKRKCSSSKLTKTFFDLKDDEPLSKISKIRKANVTKNKGPKFDESCFENFMTVTSLAPEDAKREVELRKESNNYKNCPFKCDLCFRGFEALKTYDNHTKKHSSNFGDEECEFCHLRFKSSKELSKHRISVHRRKFSCMICSYVCFCSTQAKQHMRLHKGVKYTCDQCGETFSMRNTLFMHKRIKHPTECVCALCGSTFATQKGRQSHNMLVHRQELNQRNGPFCNECDIHFSSETAWKRHLVLSSKHTVSHGCEACGETFPDAEALKVHSRTHSRKQRPSNRLCGQQLAGPCPLCEKWLENRTAYKHHMTTEHPESEAAKCIQADESSRPCVCEFCGKMFKKPCFLAQHQRVHGAPTPARRPRRAAPARHACPTCRAVLATTSALKKHIRVRHLNLRPHKCSVCNKAFPTKCEVKYHVRYVHCKVPWPKRDRRRPKKEPEAT